MNKRIAMLVGLVLGVPVVLAMIAGHDPTFEPLVRLAGWVILWNGAGLAVMAVVAHAGPGQPTSRTLPPASIEAEAERLVRRRAITHPVVALPLLAGVTALCYGLATCPDEEASGWLLLIAAVGIGCGVVAYLRRRGANPRALAEVMAHLALAEAQAKARVRDKRIEALRRDLTAELESTDAEPGARELLVALEREHRLLIDALTERRESDPLSVAVLPALADETYRRGLSVLAGAQQLAYAVRAAEGLKDSSSPPEDEREEDTGPASRGRVRRLLQEARRCVSTLASARVELIALRVDAPEVSSDHALTAMQQAIGQARRVQDEMDGMNAVRGRAHA